MEKGKNFLEKDSREMKKGKKFFPSPKMILQQAYLSLHEKPIRREKEDVLQKRFLSTREKKTSLFLFAIESARRSFLTAAASASTLVDATTTDEESHNHNGCYTRENEDTSEVHTIRLAMRNPTQAISQAIRP